MDDLAGKTERAGKAADYAQKKYDRMGSAAAKAGGGKGGAFDPVAEAEKQLGRRRQQDQVEAEIRKRDPSFFATKDRESFSRKAAVFAIGAAAVGGGTA